MTVYNPKYKPNTYLEPYEVRAIINAVPEVSNNPERDQLILETLWQTGARVSEGLALVPEHIGKSSIVLANLKQKFIENAIKEVEVSEKLCTMLKDWCQKQKIESGQWVFPAGRKTKDGHVSRWYVWDLMNRAGEKAKVYRFGKRNPKTGGRFKPPFPHSIRHSSAMKLLEEIQDITVVAQQLGHSRVTTTQAYAWVKKPRIKRLIRNIDWEGKDRSEESDELR